MVMKKKRPRANILWWAKCPRGIGPGPKKLKIQKAIIDEPLLSMNQGWCSYIAHNLKFIAKQKKIENDQIYVFADAPTRKQTLPSNPICTQDFH
jgi:hypothetical protein